jgi:hypothetical protein
MEPVSLTTAAIATLVLTQAFEKTGEMLGEEVVKAGGRLTGLLKNKFPTTASFIELAKQEPLDYGQTLLEKIQVATKLDSEVTQAVQEVEAAALADPQFPQAVRAVEDAVKFQPSTVSDYGNLAQELSNIKAIFQSRPHGNRHS